MKQDKKEKFQVGDTVWVNGGYQATVTEITPRWVFVKPKKEMGVSHCRIVPTIDRRPTLRQKIGVWWYGLSTKDKTSVVLTAVNAAIIAMCLTIFITR